MRDGADFDEFYRANAGGLGRYLLGLTGDPGAAQDIAQDAFAQAWRRWSTIRDYDNPQAWLRTVATNLANNRWRRLRTHAAALARLSPPTNSPPPGEDVVLLTAALRRLPMPVRQAIVLHHLLDLPVSAIALETDTPVGTVKARLARGRHLLTEHLSEAPSQPRKEARGASR